MSWRKEQGRAERGYHHGNLKEALLPAALGLIAEKGAAGFPFADAARLAGVRAAAPFSRGEAARRKLPMSPDELLEAEVLIYLRGLGFPTDRRSAAKGAEPPPVPPEASFGSAVPPSGPPGGPWGKPK